MIFFQSLDAYVESLLKSVEKFTNIFQRYIDTLKLSHEDPMTKTQVKATNMFMNELKDLKVLYEVGIHKKHSHENLI